MACLKQHNILERDIGEVARLVRDRTEVSGSFTAASEDNETVSSDDGNADK